MQHACYPRPGYTMPHVLQNMHRTEHLETGIDDRQLKLTY